MPHPDVRETQPIESSGSDHVFKARSEGDLRDKFATIVGQQNMLGCRNEAAVVQEFLEGTGQPMQCSVCMLSCLPAADPSLLIR
jgi:hypothetical protein